MSLSIHKNVSPLSIITRSLIILGIMSAAGCSTLAGQPTATPQAPTPQPAEGVAPATQAEVTFQVQLPANSPAGQIYLNVLDEVTGLALNAVRYPMQEIDASHYEVKLPLTVGAVIKYRYSRESSAPAIEYTPSGEQVRYRLYDVTGPGEVQDVVSAWNDQPFSGSTGRINGRVVDSATNDPIPNILVDAGGVQTWTASDGSFLLAQLPVGTQNLVAYAPDGSYAGFQQGAVIAAEASTPATLPMVAAPQVNVTFEVSVPKENVIGVPVRMAGNLLALGNTFADLDGGFSTVASRMPLLTLGADGKYSITLALHAGTDLRYKYTLGDGFWNSELSGDGNFRLRELIVPSQDAVIQDSVETWRSTGAAPMTFDVTIPADTPAGDTVSIQFNPYGWTEPIPMWSLGNNRWIYILYSPLQLVHDLSYRFCRNDQCGSADDAATMGNSAQGVSISTSQQPQTFQGVVKAWAWWQSLTNPTSVVAAQITPRGPDFLAGVEFQTGYDPTWQAYLSSALKNIQSIGSNTVVLTPTWTFAGGSQPGFSLVPGKDPLWSDLVSMADQAKAQNLNVDIFPMANFPGDAQAWWQSAPRDFGWWQTWFDLYKEFLLDHADLATRTGAKALIIGGDWLAPALPGGKLADGSSSGVPADAEARWQEVIQEVKAHYTGTLMWALSYPDGVQSPPTFLSAVDQIYVLWSAQIANKSNPTEAELETEIGSQLDARLKPFQASLNKPLVVAMGYPSAQGSATACLPAPDSNTCLDPQALSQPNPDVSSVQVDLQAQVDIYNAMFASINQRSWISGIVSRGYYPPAALQDKSESIHGKPAADVVWYWYPRLLAPAP